MAENTAAATPYAQAIFELARDAGELDSWAKALEAAASVVETQEMLALLAAPGIARDDIAAVVTQACERATGSSSEQVSNLMRLLAENRRLAALPAIARAFERFRAEAQNVVDVVLTAASPVDEERQQRIAAALKTRLGRDVNLRFQQDENLIGGARLTADDLVIDGSVRTGLAKLATALTN